LNNSLIFFTKHINKPVTKLLEAARNLDPANIDETVKFVELIKKESQEILATLRGLEDEIKELQTKEDKLKRGDLTVEDLEKKLQKNLRNWKKRNEKLDGV